MNTATKAASAIWIAAELRRLNAYPAQLARALGVGSGTVHRWVAGQRAVSPDLRRRIRSLRRATINATAPNGR